MRSKLSDPSLSRKSLLPNPRLRRPPYTLWYRRRHLLAISENPGKLDRVSRKKGLRLRFLIEIYDVTNL